MATQLFDDGSLGISKNAESDKTKLNAITEALKKLTDPQKINEMAEQLHQRGILNDKDIEELKVKGVIYQQPDYNLDLQQNQQQDRTMSEDAEKTEEPVKDDGEEMEL